MPTATERNVLEAQPRTPAIRMTRAGCVAAARFPACCTARQGIIAGQLDPRQVTRILHSATGHNTIFDLAVEGGERTKAMIVDWQYEPIKGSLLHIDLKRIAMDQKLQVSVPIVLKGEAAGVKQQGGFWSRFCAKWKSSACPATFRARSKRTSATGVRQGASRLRSDRRRQEDQIHHRRRTSPWRTSPRSRKKRCRLPEAVAAEAAAAPAEPEVIKKGKQEDEGEEGAEGCEKPEKAEKKEEEVAAVQDCVGTGVSPVRSSEARRFVSANCRLARRTSEATVHVLAGCRGINAA